MIAVRDDYSKFTKVYCLHTKNDTAEYFMKSWKDIANRNVEMARSSAPQLICTLVISRVRRTTWLSSETQSMQNIGHERGRVSSKVMRQIKLFLMRIFPRE